MARPLTPRHDNESRPANPEEVFRDPGDAETPGPCAGPMMGKECHPIPNFTDINLF